MKRSPLIFTLLMLSAGCASVVPPANPQQPVTIFLTDYGRHSSIVLPVGTEKWMEYTYGDWRWMAHEEKGVCSVLRSLFFSGSAALGRRFIAAPANSQAVAQALNCRSAQPLLVDAPDVRQLLNALDQRFLSRQDTQVRNASGLDLIRDDSHYGLLHNCNRETATWLRQLGCQVRGLALASRFRLRPRTD